MAELNNNTGWRIQDKTLAPDDHYASNLLEQMEVPLRVPGLADNLCKHLLGPNGAVDVADLKNLYLSTVQEACTQAGLKVAFADSLARYIFPKGNTFPDSDAFGLGKEIAARKSCDEKKAPGGYRKLLLADSELLNTKLATDQVGGVAAMANSFCFSHRLELLLVKYLFAQGQNARSTVMTLLFKFWITSFKTCYLDCAAKVRIAVLLHRLNKGISKASWETTLNTAFSNRRQNRYKHPLVFHPSQISTEILTELRKFFKVEVSETAPRLMDDEQLLIGPEYLVNREASAPAVASPADGDDKELTPGSEMEKKLKKSSSSVTAASPKKKKATTSPSGRRVVCKTITLQTGFLNNGGDGNDDESEGSLDLNPPTSQNPLAKQATRLDKDEDSVTGAADDDGTNGADNDRANTARNHWPNGAYDRTTDGAANKKGANKVAYAGSDVSKAIVSKKPQLKRKNVIEDDASSSDDDMDALLAKELSKLDKKAKELEKEAGKVFKRKESAVGTSAHTGWPVTFKVGKSKVTKFQPALGQDVQARWMAGKKHLVARNGGRGLCGKWFAATVTAIDHEKQYATLVYKADGLIETNVLYSNIKLA